MDMVCEKNEDWLHDFSKDRLKLKIIEIDNKKWLTAEGTTLGADNGTGICYILTLMKKIHHNELKFDGLQFNFLFTVREEYDMGGAKNVQKDLIEGDFLINLDSGGENTITIGCVGGIGFKAKIYRKSVEVDQTKKNVVPLKLLCAGLKGGHSGEDSNKGRGHAIKILSQILWKLNKLYSFQLNSINGGGAANAIPREAFAILFVERQDLTSIKSTTTEFFLEIKKQFEGIENNMDFSIEQLENYTDNKILPKNIQDKLLSLLHIIPSGPMSMHPQFKNLVFTSTNLGIIKTKRDYIKLRMLHRSFTKYYNEEICEYVMTLLKMSGLEMERIILGSYPPWTPDFNSKLIGIAKTAYQETFNTMPNVLAVHGGLEATLLIDRLPEIEAIAIGPTAEDLHSPNERLDINSVEGIWNFLINLLRKLE
jgi:dipeptidase D